MVGSQKKKPPTRAQSRREAKRQGALKKTVKESPEDRALRQHNANMANAGTIIRHALNSVRGFGVDRSLIEIQKTVRHWPLRIEQSELHSFTPAFDATVISAEEVTQDNETITSVSFSYLGKTYDFVSRISEAASDGEIPGTITLHENGDRVICMEIIQKDGQDQFNFEELRALKLGPWIENIVRIGAEIELHNQTLAKDE